VVEKGTITRAAATLGVTQPTLSGHIKELQAQYGVALLERVGRRVRPTDVGQALFEFSRRYFSVENEMDAYLTSARDPATGRLRIAADAPSHVVSAMAAFSRRFPRIHLTVSLGNSNDILAQLLDRRCDIAIAAGLPRDRRLFTLPLREHKLVALVPRQHPWASRERVRLIELAFQAVILREPGSRTREVLQRALERIGVALIDELEIGGREGVIEAVAAGLGVGVTFDSEYRPNERLTAVRFTGAPTKSREYIACLASRRSTPAVDAFMRIATELARRG
jgi:aminoethylphosphonate catabolism LysR family transcriptional regulator